MLAKVGIPFDSPEHVFEIKWDGIRALAMIDGGGCRLLSRNGVEQNNRFPELAPLDGLGGGLVIDGEIVSFRDGIPNFQSVLSLSSREKSGASVAFVAFDLLFQDYTDISRRPLHERRDRLKNVVASTGISKLLYSDGILGNGLELFNRVHEKDLEGVVAKRLDSSYEPGRRSGAWIKIKKRQMLYCAVIGFTQKGLDYKS